MFPKIAIVAGIVFSVVLIILHVFDISYSAGVFGYAVYLDFVICSMFIIPLMFGCCYILSLEWWDRPPTKTEKIGFGINALFIVACVFQSLNLLGVI